MPRLRDLGITVLGGTDGCVLAHTTVVVRSLVSGEEQVWTGDDLGVEDVSRLAWVPDSRHLAFRGPVDGGREHQPSPR